MIRVFFVENQKKGNKNMSKIHLSIIQSTGTWLNESVTPQHSYPSISLLDPNGEILAKIDMTFEQFAQLLVSNSEVTCTLSRYRSRQDKIEAEKVEPPSSINDKMTERLGEYRKNLTDRIKELETDAYEMLNGTTKVNKKALEQLLHDIKTIRSHFASNENFAVQQAQEEAAQIQESMRTQLLIFLSSKGLDVSKEQIKMLEGNREDVLKLPGEKVEVAIEPFEKKQRIEKSIDDIQGIQGDLGATGLQGIQGSQGNMGSTGIQGNQGNQGSTGLQGMTLLELADNILQRLEFQETDKTGKTRLYCSQATSTNKHVLIKYVSYHSATHLTQLEAADYLKYLRTVETIKEFKQHYHYKKGV